MKRRAPILCAIIYQFFLYLFINLFKLNNNDIYIPLLWGLILFTSSFIYAIYSKDRSIDIYMALSALPYIIPSCSLWRGEFYMLSLAIASVLGTSPLSDALLPFTNNNINFFPYYFDVTHVIFIIIYLLFNIIYNYINIIIFIINILLWISPLLFWKYNTYGNWWGAHIIWHIIGSCNIFIFSELYKYYK